MAGEPVDLLVNGRRIARGEVVAIDEEFGLRVTQIVSPTSASTPPPSRRATTGSHPLLRSQQQSAHAPPP